MKPCNLLIAVTLIVLGNSAFAATNTMRAIAMEGRIIVTELKPVVKSNDYDTGWATWSQRGELIGRGQMTDSQGRRYNVRILPGYVAPWRYASEGWSDAGSNLGEYFEHETWDDIADGSSDCFKWGWKDSFWKFGLRDSGRAWSDRFESAHVRTQKKTFGWPIAYPWAFLSATVETIIRVPVGIVGAALGTVGGVAVVPVAGAVWPTVKGVWNGGVNGVVVPVSGWAWNTVAAPPASLLASAPNPSRTDGVWMHIMSDEDLRRDRAEETQQHDEALKNLAAYGRQMDEVLAETTRTRVKVNKERNEEQAQLNKRYNTAVAQIKTNETKQLQQWLASPGNEARVVQLAQDGWDWRAVQADRARLIEILKADGLSDTDAQRILNRLINNPPATPRNQRGPYDYKTDPVVESLRIIDDVGGPEIVK